MVKPATLEDAGQMALNDALSNAGYSEMKYQYLGAEDLETELLEAVWNDDATLQEAARTAVEIVAARGRLLREDALRCVS